MARALSVDQVNQLGRDTGQAERGVDPSIMGYGPVPAVKKALARRVGRKSKSHRALWLLLGLA